MILFVNVVFNGVINICKWIHLPETWILVTCKLEKMSYLSSSSINIRGTINIYQIELDIILLMTLILYFQSFVGWRKWKWIFEASWIQFSLLLCQWNSIFFCFNWTLNPVLLWRFTNVVVIFLKLCRQHFIFLRLFCNDKYKRQFNFLNSW